MARRTVKRRRYIETTVEPSWIDSLGHVNFLQYQRIADQATDELWHELCGGNALSSDGEQFALVDVQARYLRELKLGDRIAVETRLLGYDAKRMAVQQEVLRGEELSCRIYFIAVSFHLSDRKVHAFSPEVLERLALLCDPLPEGTLAPLSIPALG